MSLASTRDKRFNAGNRMSRMLEEEQEDDFYKTTYGGFDEEEDDNEYSSDDSDHDSPSSDSDIDNPEDDEPISDNDDDGPKRKMRVVTKAYKEPAKKPTPSASTSSSKEKKSKPKEPKLTETKPKETTRSNRRQPSQEEVMDLDVSVRKSRRSATMVKHTEFQMRMQEREIKDKQMKARVARRPIAQVRRLTQEELLEEAKITEIQNIASLEMYHKLEAERKKTKTRKKVTIGNFIRYHSMSMPVVKPIQPVVQPIQPPAPTSSPGLVVVNVEQLDTGSPPAPPPPPPPVAMYKSVQRCTRNFITFSDVNVYHEAFPKKTLKTRSRAARHVCPVTRKQAKYLDPITSIPYANKNAFKVIRDTYMPELMQQMEKGKRSSSSRRKETSTS